MAIDSSIYANVGRGVKSVADFQAEYAQADQAALGMQQNRLSHELGMLKLGEAKRGLADDAQMNALYQGALSPTGSIDQNKLITGVAGAGLGSRIPGLQKGFAETNKATREAEKADLESKLKKFEVAGQIMNGVVDQATWERAKAQTAQTFGPEAAAQMPDVYDPALVENKRKQALTVKDQLEQEWKAKQYTTPDANARLSAETATANNASSTAVSRDNAQLADVRARDLNAIREDGNRLKREEKQTTADMTKASQVASFDTMLGTLDRISKHPGLDKTVGWQSKFPTVPGTDSANFQAELESFKSQAFIPMVAQLKGMGALSDAEGKKLTAAVGALDISMGDAAFRQSVARIVEDMQAAKKRVMGGGDGKTGDWGMPATPAAPKLDAVEAEMRKRGLLK